MKKEWTFMLFVKGTEFLIFTPLHLKFYFDYTQLLNCIYFYHPWQLVCCCFYFYLDIYIWINIHTYIYIYIYIYISKYCYLQSNWLILFCISLYSNFAFIYWRLNNPNEQTRHKFTVWLSIHIGHHH